MTLPIRAESQASHRNKSIISIPDVLFYKIKVLIYILHRVQYATKMLAKKMNEFEY